ncbi:phosphoadenosine phosphosulfate reductase [bacterium F11]|nr:phosphoadenosine phosphosulfate reductase [bacterium F11]
MAQHKETINFEKLNEKFERSSPQEILEWALKTYQSRIGLTSSFGAQSAALLHMATQIDPHLPILFIDTGFLFKETYEFVKDLQKRMNLNLKVFRPTETDIQEIRRRLDNKEPQCCDDAKVAQMKRALEGFDAWIAGLRRNQSATRKDVKIIEQYGDGLVKVHPVANWASKDVQNYMVTNNLPFHPLWEKGYKSIGCEPCTRKPTDSADDRSGRWAGQNKTECGIHTFLEKKDA